MAVSAERQAVLEARLMVLDEVLFKLAAGQSATAIGADGESVTFKQTDRNRVQDEINRINTELGVTVTKRPRARGVVFG